MADICPRTSLPHSLVPEGLFCIGCGYQNLGASSSSLPQNASAGQQLVAQRPQAAPQAASVQLPRDLAENAFGKALKGKAKEGTKASTCRIRVATAPGAATATVSHSTTVSGASELSALALSRHLIWSFHGRRRATQIRRICSDCLI